MVRLKVLSIGVREVAGRCFNSIVVRLKGALTATLTTWLIMFQFHSGSIKSYEGFGIVEPGGNVSIP